MRAAVLGSPVEHSLSPLLHRTAYEALGLRGWTYEAHRCEQDELAAFLAGARADDSWRGLSLTMPLKAVGAASCDELVTDLGVINTIVFERDAGPVRLVGHNTDIAGIAAAWRELGVSAERVTLLGAGGTARAAVRALADLGARQVSVHVRTAERARSVVDLARDLGVSATVGSLTALPPGVPVLSSLLDYIRTSRVAAGEAGGRRSCGARRAGGRADRVDDGRTGAARCGGRDARGRRGRAPLLGGRRAAPAAVKQAGRGADDYRVKQLGDILIDDGLLTHDQLADATAERTRLGRSLGRTLVDLGMVTEAQLVAALAAQIGMQFVDLGDYPVDGSAVASFPAAVARRYTALGIGYEDGRVVVAMADPANILALDDIRSLTGRDVKPVIGTRGDILAAINRFHRVDGDLDDLSVTLDSAAAEDEDLSAVRDAVDDAPIVKFVNLLITQAVQDRASDIHIEPTERDVRVRYRIDGVLHEIMRSPRTIHSGVVSRLKIMAEMNIAERRVPQDGRLSVSITGKKIDLRVATLPTVWGEKVVMRILDNSTAMLTLADLGFSTSAYERYARSFSKPYGMILVTGPTGSGKSTTLYATLNIVSTTDKNLITVEDPVEYRIPGINQVQVNVKAGLNFASALRSILRSDPDVVLIGEVRDHETAQIAIEASLTGHLVLTTLHTNDAPSAVSRLIEMGIEPFLVGSSLDCVLAQRLARRLCTKCKQAYEPAPELLTSAGYPWEPGEPLPELFRAVGCAACSKTGYKGRLALQEVMVVSEQIERLAVERAPGEMIARTAREEGMTTLRSDGLAKVGLGVTSLEEILRVVV